MAFRLLSALTLDIWSIVDGVRVAKVNNLAWRDQNGVAYNLGFEPYIAPLAMAGDTHVQAGLSMKVKF